MTKYVVGTSFLVLLIISVILCVLAHNAPPYGFEIYVSQWVQSIDFPGFAPLMIAFTRLGESPWVILVVLITALAFLSQNFRLEALFVLLTTSGDAIDWILKHIVDRPRPTPDLVRVFEYNSGSSFPSGHAVHAVVFWGFLVYLAWFLLKPPLLKYSTIVFLLLIILLTGLSRIYLGAHWLGDVVGGYVIGTDWLIVFIVIYRYVRTRWGQKLEYFLGGPA